MATQSLTSGTVGVVVADNDDERRWTDKAQRKAEEEYQRLTQTKCRGCGERLNDGCLSGCTDRD